MATITLDLVTPERFLIDGVEIEEVTIPGAYGEIGVLPGHAPLLGHVRPGVLTYKAGGRAEVFAVSEGFMEVTPERVTVLANSAERAADVDLDRAKEAAARAAEQLARQLEQHEFAAVEAAAARAEARLRARGLV
ncbi:MAG: F0F1 ATP synthase subunit epsilon [Myxococcales bacterium]|nr:F0F1 ATP synthase subunit epsilon [Myxococcales bacterium]